LIIPDAILDQIFYFTALATHLGNPEIIKRHKTYIACLENTGIFVEYGRFKPKYVICPEGKKQFIRHEEKETDVRIAIKVCELLTSKSCEAILLLTGDTDLVPCIEYTKNHFPEKKLVFAFPYKRANSELSKLASGSFRINHMSYRKFQFSNPYALSDGTSLQKPTTW
jgi:hypothetical protein